MMSPEATEPDRQDNAASSTVERLGDFRDYLESHPSEWLLILDNCDDMDVFKDSIDPYLPTKGRILVTTRDPRFQGDFTAADDGINVQPMNESESRELLAKSIPSRFRPCSDDSSSPAGELLGLLGNLPLAIAQAAANIVDQQVSLAEYVGYCQAASGGLEALERPVRDRHARDTRNATQSVHLTWRVSFERLEESSPLSIVLLSYMACFHWDSVPRHVVRRLPEFSDLSDLDFRRCLARCVQLSLIEEYSTEVFPQLRMHPVVHEIAWAQLSGNASDILPKCSTALRALFPMLRGEEDEGWDVGSYLAPHALRVTQLSKVLGIETKDMPGLIRHLACYFTAFGSVELACALAETALEMALRVWGRDQCSIYGLRKTKIDCLVNYSKFSHALTEIDMALGYVESDSAEAVFGCYERTHEIIETLFRRYYALKDLTRYDEAYTEAAKIERLMLSLPDFHEPNEWARVMVVRHNMAHALARAGRTEAAMRLLERVIEDSRSPDGALRVNTTTYLASQNLMAELLLRGSGNNENITLAFQIYRSVYSVSLELLGVTNKDTWVAVNNVLATTRKHPDLTQGDRHFEERLVCSILESATAPGMRQTKGGDMRLFNQAVAVFFARVSTLLTTGKISMPDHVNSLLETFRSSFLVRSDLVEERFSAIIEYNTTGVHLQHSGRYQEAESLHCLAIQGLCEYYSSDSFQPVAGLSTEKEFFELQSVFHYNIMLSIARQGRVEEGFKYRKQHQRILEYAETEYGALTTRLEQDAEDRNIYEEATARIRSGTGSRGDKWWTMHEKEIGRAERRCGRIEEVSKASEDDTPEKSKTETDEVVGPPDRKEGKGKGRISRGMVALREKIKR
jgi:tetratricopeptide (TPR) repeat protein